MVLKRMWHLTLPVFLIVADGSVAGALTPPSALTATAVSTSQIRLSCDLQPHGLSKSL